MKTTAINLRVIFPSPYACGQNHPVSARNYAAKGKSPYAGVGGKMIQISVPYFMRGKREKQDFFPFFPDTKSAAVKGKKGNNVYSIIPLPSAVRGTGFHGAVGD